MMNINTCDRRHSTDCVCHRVRQWAMKIMARSSGTKMTKSVQSSVDGLLIFFFFFFLLLNCITAIGLTSDFETS